MGQFGNADLKNKTAIFPAKRGLFRNSKGIVLRKKQAIAKAIGKSNEGEEWNIHKEKGGSWNGSFWTKAFWRKVRVQGDDASVLTGWVATWFLIRDATHVFSCWGLWLMILSHNWPQVVPAWELSLLSSQLYFSEVTLYLFSQHAALGPWTGSLIHH